MSEKAPLLATSASPVHLGPSTKDYVKMLLWPFALAVCFGAFFVFIVIVPPMSKVTVYGVAALITMLLPVIPVITAVAYAATSVCCSGFFAKLFSVSKLFFHTFLVFLR